MYTYIYIFLCIYSRIIVTFSYRVLDKRVIETSNNKLGE